MMLSPLSSASRFALRGRAAIVAAITLFSAAGMVSAQADPPNIVASTTQPGSLISFELPAWRAGEQGRVTVTAAAKLVARDASGVIAWEGTAQPDAPATIAIDRPGYYTLTATRENGADQVTAFAVVPPRRVEKAGPQIWGVQTHFGQRPVPDGAYEMLKLMNVDAVRDEFGWRGVERERGVFDFSRHQPWADDLKRHGIGLFWVAGYNNAPVYGAGEPGDRYPQIDHAEPFGRYCAEGLKRLGGNIIAIEILNEPNKIDAVTRYLPLLKGAHAAIRGAGLKHEIVSVGGAGIGGGMNPTYATKLFQAGGAAFSDGFSTHPYMTPHTPDAGYGQNANIDMALARGSALAERYGQTFWITEVGWPGPRPADDKAGAAATQSLGTAPMVGAMKQAAFTARTLLASSRYPRLKGLFIYDFQDDGHIPTRREHRFGLVRQDLTPKPGFLSFAVAADFLRDKTFVRRFHKPDGLLSANVYRAADGNAWAVVWTQEISNAAQLANARERQQLRRPMDRETSVSFKIDAVGETIRGHDWQGAPIEAKADMTATNLPIYLDLGKVDADQVTIEPRE